jgi:hypothetical protein
MNWIIYSYVAIIVAVTAWVIYEGTKARKARDARARAQRCTCKHVRLWCAACLDAQKHSFDKHGISPCEHCKDEVRS